MSNTPDASLPQAYLDARAKDEAFWQNQEKRVQGSLSQPCCTLSGISSGMITMEGDFAVIVHGEHECAACFRHIGANSHNFFCTGLGEKEFVTGETRAPLEACLRLVAEEVAPEAIFILGACPVEVIGDRFETVVEDVQKDFPEIPMVPLHTSGLKVGSQAQMLDWMWSTLAGLPPIAPETTRAWQRGEMSPEAIRALGGEPTAESQLDPARAFSLIGMPRQTSNPSVAPEYIRVIRDVGLELISVLPYNARFRDWRALSFGKACFVADRSLYPRTVNVMEDRGMLVQDVPLPIGVRQTTEFYRVLGRAFGCEEAIMERIEPERAAAQALIDAFAARHDGLHVALGLRMLNNYEPDQIAYQGLGDYDAFAELGFNLHLMVQGEGERADRFKQLYESRGITHPFEMFPEPWSLSEHLTGRGFDVAYLADHCKAEARKAGVPMIVSRGFEPFFGGVAANLDYLERNLRQVLRPGN